MRRLRHAPSAPASFNPGATTNPSLSRRSLRNMKNARSPSSRGSRKMVTALPYWMPVNNRLKFINILSAALTRKEREMGSLVKTADEIRRMAAGGRILGSTLQAVQRAAKEGTTLLELDALAEKLIHAA